MEQIKTGDGQINEEADGEANKRQPITHPVMTEYCCHLKKKS